MRLAIFALREVERDLKVMLNRADLRFEEGMEIRREVKEVRRAIWALESLPQRGSLESDLSLMMIRAREMREQHGLEPAALSALFDSAIGLNKGPGAGREALEDRDQGEGRDTGDDHQDGWDEPDQAQYEGRRRGHA